MASMVAQMVESSWSLGWEDLLEEGMATHSSSLAWRILWTEEPGMLQAMESQSIGHDWVTKYSTVIYIIFNLSSGAI